MYKIMLTVRNRLAITTKCLTALKRHSSIQHQIYIFENLTNFQTDEHFLYWSMLYQKGLISQVTFNTKESTFNAFSKAVSCNQFGLLHEMDPEKDKCDFLVFLDNDMIVEKNWDVAIKKAWEDVNKLKWNNIKVITQLPGGIMKKKDVPEKIAGFSARTGISGGSGFWTVRPNFFIDVGYLPINRLIGVNKKHDQTYWTIMANLTKNKDYILGLEAKLAMHCGGNIAGSVCNVLTKNKNVKEKNLNELIKFEASEKRIDSLSFDEFYKEITKNNELYKW
jgi:hypothetical protein